MRFAWFFGVFASACAIPKPSSSSLSRTRSEDRERAAWQRVPVVEREPASFDGGSDWMLVSGSDTAYRAAIVGSPYTGRLSAHVRSDRRPPRSELYGTIVTKVDATPYRGKRVRLSAELESEDIGGRIRQGSWSTRGWGGLSIRVDTEGGRVACFTTSAMEGVALRGTDVRRGAVELVVPHDAAVLTYGLTLAGTGWVEARDLRLEIAD